MTAASDIGWKIALWGTEIHCIPKPELGSHKIGCGVVCACDPHILDYHSAGLEDVYVHRPGVIAWKGVEVPEELPEEIE